MTKGIRKLPGLSLPPEAREIIRRLEEAGEECFLVGGAVRDALLGKNPDDLDLAASSAPEKTEALFGDCRLILTGKKHGTVGIVMNRKLFEVTSFRRDGAYFDARHPERVIFTSSLEEDLKRRDFTVNAMAWREKDGLRDPFGGEEDLKKGLLRAVGDPQKRFGEDALRILRLLRFSSALGFSAEEETGRAARALHPALERVSGERIASELQKLLAGKDAVRVVSSYREILGPILGEYRVPPAFTEDFPSNLALLFRGRSEDFPRVSERLRLSGKQREKTLLLLSELERDDPEETVSVIGQRKILSRVGEENARALERIRTSEGGESGEEALRKALSSGIPFRLSELALNGSDLIKAGARGEEIGRMLSALLTDVMEEKLENDRETLLAAAGERIEKR